MATTEEPIEVRAEGEPETSAPREADQASGRSLAWLTARGFAWNALGSGVSQVVAIGATIVVANWLTPVDYAIGGLALAAMGLFHVLSTAGFATAIIRIPELTDETCDSVFWAVTGVTGIVALGAVLLSPVLATFYERPEIARVIPLLAIGLFASSLAAVPNAMIQRAMRFRAVGGIRVVVTFIGAGTGIYLAVAGYGYYALIVPGVVSAVAGAISAFAFARYRPRLRFSRAEFAKVRTFGLSSLGSSIVLYLSDNSDYLILGGLWTAGIFGHYYFAFERARQPFNIVCGQLREVLFPALSRVQDDLAKIRRAYLEGTEKFCLLMFPLHVALIGTADVVVPFVFGSQWEPAVPVFQVFAGVAFLRSLSVVTTTIFFALDRAQYDLFFNVFRVVLTVPAIALLAYYGAGAVTVSILLLSIIAIQTPFFLWLLHRTIELPHREVLRARAPLVTAALVMGAALVATRVLVSRSGGGELVEVGAALVVSGGVFFLLSRRRILEGARELRRILATRGA